MTMRRLSMVVFFFVIFLLWNAPMVNAQFSEARVEKLRVSVDAPDLLHFLVKNGLLYKCSFSRDDKG